MDATNGKSGEQLVMWFAVRPAWGAGMHGQPVAVAHVEEGRAYAEMMERARLRTADREPLGACDRGETVGREEE